MRALFRDTTFNEDIKNWHTSNVTDMREMFENATKFEHNLAQWNTDSLKLTNNMFNGATKLEEKCQNLEVSPDPGEWEDMWYP